MAPRGKTFEVAIYNEEVRRLVQQGEHHRQLKDAWADTHYMTFTAGDAEEARRLAMQRYPESRGFVIVQVAEEH